MAEIRSNAQAMQAQWKDLSRFLARQLPGIESEFRQLPAIAQVSRDTPADLHMVAERVRRDIAVGVAYGSDLNLCLRLLGEIAAQHPKVLTAPAPAVHFTDFAASSLSLLLRVWISNLDDGLGVTTQLRLRINEVFAKNGIEISFPQLDVHIKDAPAGGLKKDSHP